MQRGNYLAKVFFLIFEGCLDSLLCNVPFRLSASDLVIIADSDLSDSTMFAFNEAYENIVNGKNFVLTENNLV